MVTWRSYSRLGAMGQAICNTSRRAHINGNDNPQPFDIILLSDIVLEQQLCILHNVVDSVPAQASSESEDSLVGDNRPDHTASRDVIAFQNIIKEVLRQYKRLKSM
jgi:predicted nicotinamide N-methyase